MIRNIPEAVASRIHVEDEGLRQHPALLRQAETNREQGKQDSRLQNQGASIQTLDTGRLAGVARKTVDASRNARETPPPGRAGSAHGKGRPDRPCTPEI